VPSCIRLLTNIKLFDQLAVSLKIMFHEVIEQATALTNQFKKTKTGRVVFLMQFQVLSQANNTLCEYCDLDLGRSGIFVVAAKFGDNGKLFFWSDIHDIRFRCYNAKVDRYSVSAMIDKPVNISF